jgi:Spy/CpxP family protein refolding chaperone
MRKISLICASPALFVLLASNVLLPACGGSQPPAEPPPPAAPPPPVASAAPPPAAPAPVAAEAPPEAPKPHMGHHDSMAALFMVSLDSVELTPDQKPPVESIKSDLVKHGEPAKEPREKLEADVADGIAAGKLDHTKVDADIKAMSAAVAANVPAIQDDMNKLYKALNPDQRKKLVEAMREKGKQMRAEHEGMEHGGMEHGGEMHEHGDKGPGHEHEHENKGGEHMGEGHEHGGPGMGEGPMGHMGDELGLTPEQKEKLHTKLEAQMKAQHAAMKEKMTAAEKHMDAVGAAFESDKFDAKKAGVGTQAPDMVKAMATAKVQMAETVLSVLTPEQRPKFLAEIKEHEAEMN